MMLRNTNWIPEVKICMKPVVPLQPLAGATPLLTACDHHRSMRVRQKLFLGSFGKRTTSPTLDLVTMMKIIPLYEKHSYSSMHGTPTPGSASR
ncbi:hypothetical protein JVT61DRAFT_890 [Boletus reticuloceps]|uniref:Uncharacterized protein n=1 Tax=Boletus reticuloceps TaxID=495285 RepID=A0A8I2YQ13_9AGAM|nr:hypothetical protein JVT61DRAFT_890 [Boletus reticuloceps]